MSKTINLRVENQASYLAARKIRAAGTTGYYKIHPVFDEQWAQAEITNIIIAFVWSDGTKYCNAKTTSVGVEWDGENDVTIPQACLARPGYLTVGALGYSADGSLALTTEGGPEATIQITDAVARNTNDLPGAVDDPDIWTTIKSQLATLEGDVSTINGRLAELDDAIITLKTSDLTNDGDGTSPFATVAGVNSAVQAESTARAEADTALGERITAETTAREQADSTLSGDIDAINGKIPAQASTSNQLADKAFVNSSVQTATANFRGNWASWAAVPTAVADYPAGYGGGRTPTTNDYLVVQDASGFTGQTLAGTWRFKYSGDWAVSGKSGWQPEYQVNETPMTAEQLAAINSGITAQAVAQIADNTEAIGAKQDAFTVGNGLQLANDTLSANLVGTSGQATNAMMTQKAVTDRLPLSGPTDPTTSTEGRLVGQVYTNTITGKQFILKSITANPTAYNWQAMGEPEQWQFELADGTTVNKQVMVA